jgi:hypothetical protein
VVQLPRVHGLGKSMALVEEAPVWAGLARTERERQAYWRQWLQTPLTDQELAAVRRAVTSGRPYGSASWTEAPALQLGLDLRPRRRGRPPTGCLSRSSRKPLERPHHAEHGHDDRPYDKCGGFGDGRRTC